MNKPNILIGLAVIFFLIGIFAFGIIGRLLIVFSCIIAFAGLLAKYPIRTISFNRQLDPAFSEIGEPVTVKISFVSSRTICPAWLLAKDTLPRSVESTLPTGHLSVKAVGSSTSTLFYYNATAGKRGYFPIGPLSISSGDLFGITQNQDEMPKVDFLTVYPKVLPVPETTVPSNRPIGDSRSSQRIFEDPSRTVGLRDYVPGDNLTRIHWKATARTGRLESKVYEPSSSLEVNIILNLYSEDYSSNEDDLELACTTTASLAAFFLDRRQLVGVLSNGIDADCRYRGIDSPPIWIKANRGYTQLATILSTISRLELSKDRPLPYYLRQINPSLQWTATILLVTNCLSDRSVQALNSLKRAGFALGVLIVGSNDNAESAVRRSASIGIPTAFVQTEESLGRLEFWQTI